MSAQNVIATHQIVVYIFQSGIKWQNDWKRETLVQLARQKKKLSKECKNDSLNQELSLRSLTSE